MSQFDGPCFRCGNPGHWAESETCPWNTKAATKTEHRARIAAFVQRYWDKQITAWQKREMIRHENEVDGKDPASTT